MYAKPIIASILASMLMELPPPPLTKKELEEEKLQEDIYYSAHNHFETEQGAVDDQ